VINAVLRFGAAANAAPGGPPPALHGGGSVPRPVQVRGAKVTPIDYAVLQRLRLPLASLGYRLANLKPGQASPELPRSA